MLPERLGQRMEDVRPRPADRLGQRLALLEGLARPVLRPLRLGQHHPRAVRQQLRDRRHPIEDERSERLGALDEQAVRHALQAVPEALRLQLRAAPGERADLVVRDQLADGRHEHARDLRRGELRGRCELAERLDLFAPVLQADRASRVAGEHVDHAAPHRELASMLDQVRARVPEVDQPIGERVGREAETGHQLQRRDGAERGDQALHRREGRGDDDERAARRAEPVDRVGAPGRDLGGGPDALVRERLPRREERHAVVAQVGGRLGGERLRFVRTGGHGQDRHVQRARQPGDDGVLPRPRVRGDRPGALEQEPLERLRADQRLQAPVPDSSHAPSDRVTNRSGQHEQASPLRDGAIRGRVYRRLALRGYRADRARPTRTDRRPAGRRRLRRQVLVAAAVGLTAPAWRSVRWAGAAPRGGLDDDIRG